jgi:hypothetical protein
MHFATFWSFIGIGIFWKGIVGTWQSHCKPHWNLKYWSLCQPRPPCTILVTFNPFFMIIIFLHMLKYCFSSCSQIGSPLGFFQTLIRPYRELGELFCNKHLQIRSATRNYRTMVRGDCLVKIGKFHALWPGDCNDFLLVAN